MMTDVTEVARRARKKMADAVPAIIKDVCELDGYTSPDDNPDLVQLTVQQLELILRRRLCGEDHDPIADLLGARQRQIDELREQIKTLE